MKTCDIEIATDTDSAGWNELVEECNGSFFHCYEYPEFEASGSNASPIYIKAFDAEKKMDRYDNGNHKYSQVLAIFPFWEVSCNWVATGSKKWEL